MLTRFRISSLFALLLLIGIPSAAQAQTTFALGPRAGIGLGDAPADVPYLGADVRVSTPALPVQINPSIDYYFVDEADFFGQSVPDDVDASARLINLSVNAIYTIGIDNQAFTPYAGGGLSLTRTSVGGDDVPDQLESSDTDTALNLLGGALFEVGGFNPFAQAHFTLGGDLDVFGITGGLLFEL
jgi:hypothetical protein